MAGRVRMRRGAPNWTRQASARAIGGPFGSVSGGKKLAFLPLSGGVFPRKILARFGRGIHVAHSRAFWKVPTRQTRVFAPRPQMQAVGSVRGARTPACRAHTHVGACASNAMRNPP